MNVDKNNNKFIIDKNKETIIYHHNINNIISNEFKVKDADNKIQNVEEEEEIIEKYYCQQDKDEDLVEIELDKFDTIETQYEEGFEDSKISNDLNDLDRDQLENSGIDIGKDETLKTQIENQDEENLKIEIPKEKGFSFKKLKSFLGPALFVSVGYLDPGNWATDLEGGSKFGYSLIWVLLLSNIMALFLQYLSFRIALVTQKDLAQVCGIQYSNKVIRVLLWLVCEIAIASTDMAEVIGTAIGLNILFHIPLLAGVVITALDTLLFLLIQRWGIRKLEIIILVILIGIAGCLLVELFLSKPNGGEVMKGFIPTLTSESILVANGIIGATVMPHNLFLHSGVVKSRKISKDDPSAIRQASKYNLFDTLLALNFAFFVNVSILILSGTEFWKNGLEVDDLTSAHQLLGSLLGSKVAPILFGIGLLLAGQSSTITGTMAGQIVMEGFLDLKMRPWIRRLMTRLMAILPATIVILIFGSESTFDLLILSQVILSIALPFAIIPLIQFTSDRSIMGQFKNPILTVVNSAFPRKGHRSNYQRNIPNNLAREYYESNVKSNLKQQQQNDADSSTATPEQYLVESLPGLDAKVNITHYAGLIQASEQYDGNLFFWFFQANVTEPLKAPVLIWINGGPGCSSMDGIFLENGPLRIQSDYSIQINPFSWHNYANVLYIDQPFGTGLSYISDNKGIASNDQMLEQYFYSFVQKFFNIFSDYQSLPLYISGESYAGHYIPHFANYILQQNELIQNGTNNGTVYNLEGLAIGNGWTHPIVQYQSYNKFGYAAGIIGTEQYNNYTNLINQCQKQINANNFMSDECDNVMGTLQSDSGNATSVNVYDIRLYDPTGGSNWPEPGITYEANYLNLPGVRAAIHATATPQNWTECNDTVNGYLNNQDESSLHFFPFLLSKLRILAYNGQFDLICNHVGTTMYLDEFQWSGSAQWTNEPRYIWQTQKDGMLQTAGYSKNVGNLTFLLVLAASHMAPYDQPETTANMIYRFLNNNDFKDIQQSLGLETTSNSNGYTSKISQGAWIGIVIGGFVFGILIGALFTFILYKCRSKHHHYSRLN
eukprot:gene5827-7251_t